MKEFWRNLNSFHNKCLTQPYLTSQTAFFGFTNTYPNDTLIKNHILLVFKKYVYKSRKYEKISLNTLTRNVTKEKKQRKKIAENNEKKIMLYNKKWKIIENKLIK